VRFVGGFPAGRRRGWPSFGCIDVNVAETARVVAVQLVRVAEGRKRVRETGRRGADAPRHGALERRDRAHMRTASGKPQWMFDSVGRRWLDLQRSFGHGRANMPAAVSERIAAGQPTSTCQRSVQPPRGVLRGKAA
jgi:hypothetical protein